MVKSKSFSQPDKLWTFADGSNRVVVIFDDYYIGRGEYKPGWRWSEHAGKQTGQKSQAHTGYIISGRMSIRDARGKEYEAGPGEAFHSGPEHDAWVVGDEICIALDFGKVKL